MLGGTDKPEDVAAILAWFKEDPRRLPAIASVSGGGSSAAANTTQGTTFITLSDLTTAHLTSAPQSGDQSDPQFAWQRAMAMIRSSFVQIRGPWPDAASGGDDVDEDDVEGLSERASAQQRAKDKSRRNFSELLEVILDPALKGGAAPLALSLAHFLTDRIRPETHEVQSWVRRISNPALQGWIMSSVRMSAVSQSEADGRFSGWCNPSMKKRRNSYSRCGTAILNGHLVAKVGIPLQQYQSLTRLAVEVGKLEA